jgi:predicted unusual protein kinase regulating ubiquinone biosynthesis (AarF/ABC1/UbiB family)
MTRRSTANGRSRGDKGAAATVSRSAARDLWRRLLPASSSTGRALRLAGLTAGVTGSYVGYMMQRLVLGHDGDEKRRAVHATAGRRIRDELMSLRGPVMKVGQALSLHTDLVPEDMLAELTSLQMEAPGMHPSLARAQFKASLGRDPEQVFARFEDVPFAAASLGQVHRATLRDGTRVVVKIQYPEIRGAIRNDFRLLRQVALPARASGHLPVTALDEMETEIDAETDYLREAAHLEFFGDALRPLTWITVPRPFPRCSTDRVLTMTEVGGLHLDAFLSARPSQRVRDAVGSRLMELFYFQLLVSKRLHADPHWGNYLFREDGSIGLVDFGCVKTLEDDVVRRLRRSFLYAGRLDSAEFHQMVQEQFAGPGKTLAPRTRRAVVQFAEQFYRRVYPPGPTSVPVDFAEPTLLRDFMRVANNLLRAKGVVPAYIFISRAEIGLYATLHRLRARVPTSDIVRRLLAISETSVSPARRSPVVASSRS